MLVFILVFLKRVALLMIHALLETTTFSTPRTGIVVHSFSYASITPSTSSPFLNRKGRHYIGVSVCITTTLLLLCGCMYCTESGVGQNE